MTKQNQIHKYIRKCQQERKRTIKNWQTIHPGRPVKRHTRKWWNAWHKTWMAGLIKEGTK